MPLEVEAAGHAGGVGELVAIQQGLEAPAAGLDPHIGPEPAQPPKRELRLVRVEFPGVEVQHRCRVRARTLSLPDGALHHERREQAEISAPRCW